MAELISYSPISLEEVGRVDTTDPKDIGSVVERCRAAQSIWAAYPRDEKVRMLKNLRLTLTDNAERIARTAYLETGKSKADAFNTEVLVSAMMVKECERWVKDFKYTRKVSQGSAKMLTSLLGRRSYLEYRPLGVVAVIAPYNFPFSLPFTEIATAVAAGNGVVLKPSSDTPLCGHLIETMFREAGFPEGLVIAVSGPGVGSALNAAKVDKIIFTGSTSTGKKIMSSASEGLVPVVLELGGKDAMVVFDDADLERTVAGAVWGSFVNTGQVCVGVKRIYVQNGVYDEFMKQFVQSVKGLRHGDGWDDPSVSLGPVINEEQLNDIENKCMKAVEDGGVILTGGKRDPEMKGYFFEPTVIADLPHSSKMVDEEIFGPVVMVFRFDTEKEAVEMASSGSYALGGSVWTRDIDKGRRVALGLGSGSVDVNNTTYTFGLPATPWGGRKQSGFGTTHSIKGFEDMMFAYHVHVDKGKYYDPWWMPYNAEKADALKEMIDAFYGSGKGKLSVIRRIFPILKNKK